MLRISKGEKFTIRRMAGFAKVTNNQPILAFLVKYAAKRGIYIKE